MSEKTRQKGIKISSSLLIFTIFITYMPIQEFSRVFAETKGVSNKQEEEQDIQSTTSSIEIKEMRTVNSKTFLNTDGTYSAEISQSPIHYQNENKQWESINNQLVSYSITYRPL